MNTDPTPMGEAVDAFIEFTFAWIGSILGPPFCVNVDPAEAFERAVTAMHRWIYGPLYLAGAHAADDLEYYGGDS